MPLASRTRSVCSCSSIPSVPHHPKYRHEYVQQIQINLDGGPDVLIRPVKVAEAPGIEYQQSAEQKYRHRREPKANRRVLEKEVQEHRADQHPQADHEEASPRTEVAAAHESVQRENSEGTEGQHRRLTNQPRLRSSIEVERRSDDHSDHEVEEQDQADVHRELGLLARGKEQRRK